MPGRMAQHRKLSETTNARQISNDQLRQLFNDAQVLEKAATKEYTEKIIDRNHPSELLAEEPICTESQIVAYFAPDGNEVARAHRYLRPDGTIGLMGRPDPKRMYHSGALYYIDVS